MHLRWAPKASWHYHYQPVFEEHSWFLYLFSRRLVFSGAFIITQTYYSVKEIVKHYRLNPALIYITHTAYHIRLGKGSPLDLIFLIMFYEDDILPLFIRFLIIL
jgi:hypothetical protein